MRPRNLALAAVAVVLVGGVVMRGRQAPSAKPSAPAAGQAAGNQSEVVIPVEAVAVQRGTMLRTLAVTGSLKTDRDVHITSKIAGKVASVAVKEGDRVRAGQLLLSLDEGEFRAQLAQQVAALRSAQERLAQAKAGESTRYTQADTQIDQTKASLAAAKVRVQQMETTARLTDASLKANVARAGSALKAAQDRLRITKDGARTQERRVAQNAVDEAKVNRDNAKARLDRRRKLFSEGAISKEELDEMDRAFQLADEQYNSAMEQRNLIQEGARSEDVRIAEEGVRQAQESLTEAQANLERNKISTGDIDSAREQVAQLEAALKGVQAGKSTYKIVPLEIAAAQAAVDEARAKVDFALEQVKYVRITSPVDGVVSTCTVNEGESIGTATALMNVVALNGIYFEAQVPELSLKDVRPGQPVKVSVDSLGDKTFSGTIREMIPVAGADSKSFRVRVAVTSKVQLPVGAFARGQVEIGRNDKVLLIPKECLLSMAGDTYVYRVMDGHVKRQSVKLGDADAANIQILEGLSEGDKVVSAGAADLSDGARVSIKP